MSTKINPEHIERFRKYLDPNILSLVISPISAQERKELMKSMRDKGNELLAELEAYKPVNFRSEDFTNSVSRKELDVELSDLEEFLTETLFEKISENPGLVAHGEIGRMLKGLADKFQKIAANWEAQQNFSQVAETVENMDTSSLRSKADIHRDYLAIRAFYERAREMAHMMYGDENLHPGMPERGGNFSDDIKVPEIPICYSWMLPFSMTDIRVRTTIVDTPFFSLALEYGFIDGTTEKYDIIDFQNDVFKFIVLPILLGLFSCFPVGFSGGFISAAVFSDLPPVQKMTYEKFVALYSDQIKDGK